jgi:hypothetical protein
MEYPDSDGALAEKKLFCKSSMLTDGSIQILMSIWYQKKVHRSLPYFHTKIIMTLNCMNIPETLCS